MADILEFGAMYYNTEKYSLLDDKICPPSEELSENLRKEYSEKHPYNFVNLVDPEGNEEEKYRNSMKMIFSWLLRDVVLTDSEPSVYLYEQSFVSEGQNLSKFGFISLLGLNEQVISKYQKSDSALVEQHLKMISETETEMEAMTVLYRDQDASVFDLLKNSDKKEMLRAKYHDGSLHVIYRLPAETAASLKEKMSDKTLTVAQYPHRYDALLRFRDSKKQELDKSFTGKESFNFGMALFMSADDPAQKWLPVNRLIKVDKLDAVSFLKKCGQNFKMAAMQFSDTRMERAARIKMRRVLKEYAKNGKTSVGLYLKEIPSKYFILILKDEVKPEIERNVLGVDVFKTLDVKLIEQAILKPLLGMDLHDNDSIVEKINDNEALDAVKNGEYALALMFNPVSGKQITSIAESGSEVIFGLQQVYPLPIDGLLSYSFKYSGKNA